MACAVSTDLLAAGARAEFDLDRPWQLHPQVSVRPEHFGALMYHFGTRRLSFLKSPVLLTVVRALDTAPSARAACATALATLARTQMIRERSVAGDERPGDERRGDERPGDERPGDERPLTGEGSAS
jgi:putative mycofactocin binding protein MftB